MGNGGMSVKVIIRLRKISGIHLLYRVREEFIKILLNNDFKLKTQINKEEKILEMGIN